MKALFSGSVEMLKKLASAAVIDSIIAGLDFTESLRAKIFCAN